jgi:filamentous hemagglutinin family protein
MSRGNSRWIVALMATTALAGAPAAVGAELPGGASVAAGQVSVGSPHGNTLRIRESSGSGVVNWNSFSIGADGKVVIRQPSADAALLNRVTGATPSTIAGQLKANGQVYLVNPNGIAITKSGVVKTGAFVGSSLGISDGDFMAGNRSFAGSGSSAAVTNAGRITTAPGGYAALIGGRVANDGVISVPLGKIGLGSGEAATLDFSGDGFLQVAVPTAAGGTHALIGDRGKLRADGGRIEISAATALNAARNAINLSGLAEARSVSGRPGAIVLGGGDGGKVRISGRLDVSAAKRQRGVRPLAAHGRHEGVRLGGAGGSIAVTGAHIALHHAHLNASGSFVQAVLTSPPLPIDGGGGTVRIGGGAHGRGTLPHATTVTADRATTIRADGLGTGDGGSVVLWSDGETGFFGRISARGGALGGDGGFAEVSGHDLAYHGMIDLRAPQGAVGTLLLDPFDVTISSASTSGGSLAGGTFTPVANDSVLNATALLAALGSANVQVTTGASGLQPGDIKVEAPLSWSAATTLTLNAAGSIAIDRPITATNGSLALTAGALSAISASAAVNIGGVFDLTQGNWSQLGALPAFSAHDFRVTGGTFVRATAGTGSAGSPYQIADVYGLQGIDSLLPTFGGVVNFVLANDIDASGTAKWNAGDPAGTGFVPIGDSFTFLGTLDGQGHVIDGLFINRPTINQVGLFSSAVSADVSNLGLTNVNITGEDEVGALAGSFGTGTVTHVFSTGTVNGETAAGGLIGFATPQDAGTLTITQSFSSAAVTASAAGGPAEGAAGGLIGSAGPSESSTLDIEQSYATGAVSASGGTGAGGLIGAMTNVGSLTVDQSYAAGHVSAATSTAGLLGVDIGSVTFTNSFWDTTATGQATSGVASGTTGLTSAAFQDLTNFVPLAQGQGWNFETTWSPPSNVAGNAFYPELYTMQPVIRQIVDPNPTSTYGNTPAPANTGTIGGPGTYIFGPVGDSITFGPGALATTATNASPVGSYPISGRTATSADGIVYNTVATKSGTAGASMIPQIVITPRPISVVADPKTKVYDNGTASDPALTFTVGGSGLGPADTIATTFTGALARAAGENVGSYAISQGTLVLTSGNYTLAGFTPAAFTITPAALTITADDLTKTYGDKVALAGTAFTVAGLVAGDAVTGVTLKSTGAKASAAVAGSPYAITASNPSGTGLGNYTIAFAPGALTVRRAPLTVTADDQTKTVGQAFTFGGTEFTVTGLKNGDSVATATITSGGAAKAATVAGSPYAIDIANAKGAGLANYKIAYVPGAFTVEPGAPATNALLPITPGTGPIDDPPDIVDTTFGGGGGGGPILSLPTPGVPPTTTLTFVRNAVSSLQQEIGQCERRRHEGRQVYIKCVANALDGFATNLDRHVLELPPPLRQVAAAIHRAAARVRAAKTVAEARAAVQGAIAEVRRVLVVLRAGEPATTRLEGNAIVTALQSVNAGLLRATGL